MAAVAPSFPRHSFDRFDVPKDSYLKMDPATAVVQLVPRPDFVFPARPSQASSTPSPSKRPTSMQLNLSPPPPPRQRTHQRQSVSTLPTFTFNATDSSGLGPSSPPLPSPSLTVPATPSRNIGHRRRASEFVGGDSRFGVSTLVSTSPAKPSDTLPLPTDLSTTGSPGRRRGHAHRRSAAISGHDLASILQPRDVNQAPQMNPPVLPNKESPPMPSLEAASDEPTREEDPSGSVTGLPQRTTATRPFTALPSTRPRVGFSENVEYIPRPLSTISSDTTSSASTIRGHSVTNSISSVISLGGVGVPSPRRSYTPPAMDHKSGAPPPYTTSLTTLPPNSQAQTSGEQGKSPLLESAAHSPSFSIKFDAPERVCVPSKKKSLRGKLDRRRSEPLISTAALEQPGLSTLSLHEPVVPGLFEDKTGLGHELNRKSSRRKVKDWANAFLGRKTNDPRKTKSMILQRNTNPPSEPDTPTTLPEASFDAEPNLDAEPDLDALFSQDPFGPADYTPGFSFPQSCPEIDLHSTFSFASHIETHEDPTHMIDLDAALGPYGTPSMSGGRRQMHSASMGKRGMDRGHNRTYSLPALTPFQFERPSSPVRSSMADVFEEDEEAETTSVHKPAYEKSGLSDSADSDDESGTGIQIVDAAADHEDSRPSRAVEHGLGIEEQSTHDDLAGFSPSMVDDPLSPVRRTSVVEDTIIEEASPVEIVGDFEEPRTSLMTKSSDSSDASTLLASRRSLGLPTTAADSSPLSPASFAASTFSSQDCHNQQTFFDPSRLGTSTSSMTDNRTISSFATGEHALDMRMSVDDVPSLTSSRSTMISSTQHPIPRRDFSGRSGSVISVPAEMEMMERRRKRTSIQSLSKLVGAPFGESRTRLPCDKRPQTAAGLSSNHDGNKRKENRLSKLMFWRSKGDTRSFSSTK